MGRDPAQACVCEEAAQHPLIHADVHRVMWHVVSGGRGCFFNLPRQSANVLKAKPALMCHRELCAGGGGGSTVSRGFQTCMYYIPTHLSKSIRHQSEAPPCARHRGPGCRGQTSLAWPPGNLWTNVTTPGLTVASDRSLKKDEVQDISSRLLWSSTLVTEAT